MQLACPGFVGDLDYMTAPEIEADPFYQEFLYPRGYGWVAAIYIRSPTGESICVSVERQRQRGAFERGVMDRLDAFGPHLARAGLLAARLGLERVHVMTKALASVGLPAAAISASGRAIAMNGLFERLMPDVVIDSMEGLRLTASRADYLLSVALSTLRSQRFNHPFSIPVAAQADRPPMIFHVVPVRRAAHDVFASAAGIIIVTPVLPAQVPTAEVLQGLFDLTPAESRVARGIGAGQTVEVIANALGLSRETVRSQLKAVLSKTGLNRQAELASL